MQRDRRGDPHRPPRPLPGDARRERQPGPLARRQPAHARGARRARAARRDRRGDDRDRPPGRLRAAGVVAVREVGGDVLQLRVPRATSSTCAARCSTRCPARSPSPRSTPGCARRSARSPRTTTRRCGRPPSEGRAAFADAFFAAAAERPELGRLAPVVLYRTLGPTLPDGAAAAAVLWGAGPPVRAAVPRVGRGGPASTARGSRPASSCSTPSSRARRASCSPIDEADGQLARLHDRRRPRAPRGPRAARRARRPRRPRRRPAGDPAFPFVLSAGERRSFTANTIFRDPAWRKRDAGGALRISPADAAASASSTATSCGSRPSRGAVVAPVEVTEMMQPGHVSLPNGLGLDHPGEDGVPGRHRRGAERAHRRARTATGWPARRGTSTCPARLEASAARLNRCAAPASTTGPARSPGPPTSSATGGRRSSCASCSAAAPASTTSRSRSGAAGPCSPSGSTASSTRACS